MAPTDRLYNPARSRRIRRIATQLAQETKRPLNLKIALLRLDPQDLDALERLIALCEHTPSDRPIGQPEPEQRSEGAAASRVAA